MAASTAPDCAQKTEKLCVSEAPGPFVHKPTHTGVRSCVFRRDEKCDSNCNAEFLAQLTQRQIAIAAAYLDNFTQAQIAFQWRIHQATVSRELDAVRQACHRIGRELPRPIKRHKQVQLSSRAWRALGIA